MPLPSCSKLSLHSFTLVSSAGHKVISSYVVDTPLNPNEQTSKISSTLTTPTALMLGSGAPPVTNMAWSGFLVGLLGEGLGESGMGACRRVRGNTMAEGSLGGAS